MTADSPRHSPSEAEWRLRCELAALYRLMAHFRMTDVIYTHISARLPGEKEVFLINRYGVLFRDMRASDLVRIDTAGEILERDPGRNPVIQAGFTIHSAIHMARPDARFVMHSHTEAGIAVSAQQDGLLPLSQHALKFHDWLSYHDYEGIAVDLAERASLAADLGPRNKAMVLRNHGLLTVGDSAGEAFSHLYFLEAACKIQIAAQAGGARLRTPRPEVVERTAAQWQERMRDPQYFPRFWNACLQLIAHEREAYEA